MVNVPILTCPNNNFVIMYYVLVNGVKPCIGQNYIFFGQKYAPILNPNIYFYLKKMRRSGQSFFFSKVLRFYTSLNMAVSGSSAVHLLLTAFSPNKEHFPLKSLHQDLAVEKVRMVANC